MSIDQSLPRTHMEFPMIDFFRPFRHSLLQTLTCSIVLLVMVSGVPGQQGQYKSVTDGDIVYTYQRFFQIELTPAQLASGRHQFVYDHSELVDGNAASYYYRACLKWYELPAELQEQFAQNWEKWIHCPLNEIPTLEATEFLQKFDAVDREFQTAVHRRQCEWDQQLSQIGLVEFSNYDLSELRVLRSIIRLNQLRTRVQIAAEDFQAAFDSITAGLKLARDVNEFPFVVAGLIGESFAQTSLLSSLELSQIKGAPNNLMAICSIDTPIIDFLSKLKIEHQLIESSFEFLQAPETSDRTPAQWQAVFSQAVEKIDHSLIDDRISKESLDRSRNTRLAILMAQLYPIAKQRLVESGWDPEQIESMPVGQVVAIQTRAVWDNLTHRLFDFQHMPPTIRDQINKFNKESSLADLGFPLGDFPIEDFSPISDINLHTPENRTMNRQIVMMKNLELIRDFAAQSSTLPTNEQYLKLKTFNDPANNQPFEYKKMSNHSATLQTESIIYRKNPNYRGAAIRFEIKLKQ